MESKLQMNDINSRIAIISGAIGGFGSQILNIDAAFIEKLIEGAIGAFLFGFLGVAGKELFDYLKKKYIKRKAKKDINNIS